MRGACEGGEPTGPRTRGTRCIPTGGGLSSIRECVPIGRENLRGCDRKGHIRLRARDAIFPKRRAFTCERGIRSLEPRTSNHKVIQVRSESQKQFEVKYPWMKMQSSKPSFFTAGGVDTTSSVTITRRRRKERRKKDSVCENPARQDRRLCTPILYLLFHLHKSSLLPTSVSAAFDPRRLSSCSRVI